VLHKPAACVFTGGCNGTSARVEGSGSNGTSCGWWMEEGETCAVTCSVGEPVGQFTCVMMVVAGESVCAEAGAETTSVTMLAGSFRIAMLLPQGASMESKPFLEMIKGSLSEGLGLWPDDFSRFVIEVQSSSSGGRRLGSPRRLTEVTFDISYELMVRDLTMLGSLQRDLKGLDLADSSVAKSFSRTLLANGCQVLSIAVVRAPTYFQGTVLLQSGGGSSAVVGQDLDTDTALNTSTIAGGFIGAMIGLSIVTAIIYILTRSRRKGVG